MSCLGTSTWQATPRTLMMDPNRYYSKTEGIQYCNRSFWTIILLLDFIFFSKISSRILEWCWAPGYPGHLQFSPYWLGIIRVESKSDLLNHIWCLKLDQDSRPSKEEEKCSLFTICWMLLNILFVEQFEIEWT